MPEPIEVLLTDQDYDQAFGRLYRENMALRKALEAAVELARQRVASEDAAAFDTESEEPPCQHDRRSPVA